MSSRIDLTMFRNKAWSRDFVVYDLARQPINLDNAVGIAFTVKDESCLPDSEPMIQAKLADGITVVTVDSVKKARVQITAAKMDVPFDTSAGVYDLQVKLVGEEAEIACYGQITFLCPVLVGDPV